MSKLQELRKSRGLSQRQLSDLSGVRYRTLQSLEIGSGGRSIDNAGLDKLVPLAEALNVKLWELVDDPQLAEAVRRVCL